MVVGNEENGFDGERHVSTVVQFVFVRYFSIRQMLIKHLVFILGHFAFVSEPDGLKVVYEISVELYWKLVEDGVLSYYFLYGAFSAKFDGVFIQTQNNARASVEIEVVYF